MYSKRILEESFFLAIRTIFVSVSSVKFMFHLSSCSDDSIKYLTDATQTGVNIEFLCGKAIPFPVK